MTDLRLTYGSHEHRETGMCLMEAVAFLAGEEHSDRPECACPVLASFGRSLNDRMGLGAEGDALRTKYLAPLASRLVGTRSTPEVERARAYFFADRAVRLFVPLALDSEGLKEEAERLRGLPEMVDRETACAAWDAADSARADRDASWAADAADEAACAAWAAYAVGASDEAACAVDVRAARAAYSRSAAGAARAAGAAVAAAGEAAAHAAWDDAASDWAAKAAASAADAADEAADAAAWADDTADAWGQAAQVLAEACEIK